jgi:cytochrome c peroxidase
VGETAPWTWHGWQQDLDDSIQTSLTETMQGKPATKEEVAALRAYITSLALPPNPFLASGEAMELAAARGKEIFESSQAACATCHSGPMFSDGLNHDVGLGADSDKYPDYNTPSLRGAYAKARYLHDGRAKSLEAVLTKYHGPEIVSGGEMLTDEQVQDLVAYLKTL